MAKMNFDEEGLLEEPCLSCDEAYMEDIWNEWCCDKKECLHKTDRIIQKPLDCRIAHCGASCARITVEQMKYLYNLDVTKCPFYERRDDLYMNDLTEEVLDKIRAEIDSLPRELPTDSRNMVRKTRVLDIIDKYRGE